jgi:hypothetical protein
MPKPTVDLSKETFKKIKTFSDLTLWLRYVEGKIPANTPILMQSDEEGNQINKILCLDYTEIGLVIVPLEE